MIDITQILLWCGFFLIDAFICFALLGLSYRIKDGEANSDDVIPGILFTLVAIFLSLGLYAEYDVVFK